jgi:hypothetical protein
MARAYAPGDETAGMHFPLDYYANPARVAISAWTKEMAPLSWAHWLLFDGLSAADANRIPTLMRNLRILRLDRLEKNAARHAACSFGRGSGRPSTGQPADFVRTTLGPA